MLVVKKKKIEELGARRKNQRREFKWSETVFRRILNIFFLFITNDLEVTHVSEDRLVTRVG